MTRRCGIDCGKNVLFCNRVLNDGLDDEIGSIDRLGQISRRRDS